jgi:hypothetical protein
VIDYKEQVNILIELSELQSEYIDASNEALTSLLQLLGKKFPSIEKSCPYILNRLVTKTAELNKNFTDKHDL